MNKKKWCTLTAIGAALLLIPRRSSRQTLAIDQHHLDSVNKGKGQSPNKEAKADNNQ